MEFLTSLIAILVVLIVYLLVPKKRPKNFPPGPNRIPILGNAPKYSPQNQQEIMKLTDTYGPIIGLQIGSYWMVMLNSADDTRECFNRPDMSGRYGYNPFYEENVTDDTKGVVMSHGKHWLDMRRFSMKTSEKADWHQKAYKNNKKQLEESRKENVCSESIYHILTEINSLCRLKDFGMGKRSSIESIIMDEVEELIEELRKSIGKPLSTQAVFNPSVLNIIWVIVAGERFKLGDKRMAVLLHDIFDTFQMGFAGIKQFNFLFPSLVTITKMFPKLFGYIGMPEAMTSFMKETIQEHRMTMEVGNPRDFIDSFLEESIKTKDDPGSSFNDSEDKALVTLLTDLFGAGSETTSTTLTWTFFFLALHPDVQEKLFAEIQSIAGTRKVQLEDRQHMPYCEAVMTEVYRMSSLAPLTIPHSNSTEITFKGYTFPKNTIVFGNLYAAHFCKETWGDPHTFRPDRFLSKDGSTFVKNSNILAFSVGKRQCLGESLARDEHFLFMNNMIQQFKFVFPKDEPKHSMEAIRGLVLSPEPHRLMLFDRNGA